MSGLLRASVDARLDKITETAKQIKASLYSCPSVTVGQLDSDLEYLAELARNLADNNNRDD